MTDSGTVTLLFTDLVNSTELVSRTGGESAQRIFDAHHKLLSDAVSASGGQEVKWLGDGVMVAFLSADAALSRAIVADSPALDPATRSGLRISSPSSS
jgi:class 3 adenylate cyclase